MFGVKLFFVGFLSLCLGVRASYDYHGRVGIKRAEELKRAELIGRSSRIIGGAEVPEEELNRLPFQAGIIIILESGWTSVCGGALVSNEKVLTAAHCWYDGENQARLFTVVLGAQRLFFDGLRLVTSTVATHPQWNPETRIYDVAVATIPEVTLTDQIQLVALPIVNTEKSDLFGENGVISGFGKRSDDERTVPFDTSLHETSVTIISDEECEESFRLIFTPHESQVCTSGIGPVGLCDGDSGGPLTVVMNGVTTLVGVASFHRGTECEIGLPSVYTVVTTVMGWIQEQL